MASSIEVFSLFEIINHLFGSSLIKFECKNLNEVGGVSRQREKASILTKIPTGRQILKDSTRESKNRKLGRGPRAREEKERS